MAYIAPLPYAVLSRSGHRAGIVAGSQVTCLDTRSGAAVVIPLAGPGHWPALEPRADLLAVSGSRFLSLFRADGTPLATAPLAGPLARLGMGEGGLVVGVTGLEEDGAARLAAWQGPTLRPLVAGRSLGPVRVEGLQVDGARLRVLCWGTVDHELDPGHALPPLAATTGHTYRRGERFCALFALAEGTASALWAGEHLPERPNGFLFPLGAGQLGVYNRDSLVVLAPASESGGPWQPAEAHPWGDLETMAASPGGNYLAWLWSTWDGQRDTCHVQTARVDGSLVDRADLEEIGQFPALAVDDEGRATLAFSRAGNRIVVLSLQAGRMILQVDVKIG